MQIYKTIARKFTRFYKNNLKHNTSHYTMHFTASDNFIPDKDNEDDLIITKSV